MSETQEQPTQEEVTARRIEESAASAAASAGAQEATRRHRGSAATIFEELGDVDLADDSDLYSWIEEELGPAASSAFTKGNRGRDFEDRATLHPEVLGMMHLAEHRPGSTLQDHPEALAVIQGAHRRADDPTAWSNEEAPQGKTGIAEEVRWPFSSDERRVVREAYAAIGNLRTLSIGGAAVDAATKIRNEIERVSNDGSEDDGGSGLLQKYLS